ncbi:P-loop containing nucleoside triphosphate hydrolase protein [Mrakia frigida]|uniref:ATP-dependent helicase n=1 Tax=Mrakia frigida TaxID=29902 RepID=UPI003FCC250B
MSVIQFSPRELSKLANLASFVRRSLRSSSSPPSLRSFTTTLPSLRPPPPPIWNEEPLPNYLKSLNERQHRAVTSDPSLPTQILAGPGAGKTRVLTSRIVHIIEHHGILPNEICAVTFTNKSANEMKERLISSIGSERTSKLILGTFHSLCARYLRCYGSRIGLPNNFTIQDTADGKKLVKFILSSGTLSSKLKPMGLELDAGSTLDKIGKAKSKGITHAMMQTEGRREGDSVKVMVSEVFAEYENEMRLANALDFEDLLLRGVELFEREPKVTRSLKHIFVDEYQDTNVTQYNLLKLLAKASGCVTVVGDPDQSIYGWRSADIGNLSNMKRDFPETQIVLLEDNFRSTGSILTASLDVINQDLTRHPKGLVPFHPRGHRVVCERFANGEEEARFIATEIGRVKVSTGMDWSDFAILLRYRAMSRSIEYYLTQAGIPYRMVAGSKFFDRAEIKIVLAYLQIADNPSFLPAFNLVANVPKRRLGPAALRKILLASKEAGVTPFDTHLYTPPLSTDADRHFRDFIGVVDKLRSLAEEGASVSQLIYALLRSVDLEEHWKDTWEDRLDNIMELVNYSALVSNNAKSQAELPVDAELDHSERPSTPLRIFLESSMLSTDTTTREEEENVPRVVLSTVHAAKGLEYPVVFVPGVETGIYPFYRCEEKEEIEEERRLLYVAMTRAEVLLYTTHAQRRQGLNGKYRTVQESPFFTPETTRSTTRARPILDSRGRRFINSVLRRPPFTDKEEAAIERRMINAGYDLNGSASTF